MAGSLGSEPLGEGRKEVILGVDVLAAALPGMVN